LNFAHLHTHSYYSMMRGTASIEELCTAVRDRGMDSFALTDTNGIYGLIFFLGIARELGVTPIIGSELRHGGRRAVVIARDEQGYANMCQILSRLHSAGEFSLAEELRSRHQGLFILSDSEDLVLALGRTPDTYLELIAGQPARERLRFARENGIQVVATGDVHFVEARDYKTHKLLRAIDLNTKLSRVPAEELAPESGWLRSPAQMREAFSHCPEALDNALRIASHSKAGWRPGRTLFPKWDHADAPAELSRKCYEGARERYGTLSREVRERIEYELSIIQEKGFCDYFLIVQDMVNRAPRTCGRGSAAASIVSYCLGITHVDPIAHNLLFERFLNPGREDLPDIDVDFPWDERDEILDYVFEKYGRERVAMVSNHVSLRARAAIREVAKVYGLGEGEIGRVTRKLAGIWVFENGEEIVRNHPRFRNLELADPWPQILKWARRLEGFPRNLSVHCGGIVITPDEISRHVPVEPAPKGVNIVQWEKDQTEDSGLVKIDLLGNRSLAVIRDALRAIEKNCGRKIDYRDLNPLEDKKTLELMASGRTIGVFYVESPAMRQLQAKTGVGDFEHLVIHSSMIRPAANRFINEYVRRLKGASYTPLHPALDRLLGIMCYQEDVTKAAMAIAGFDVVKADDLRKALSKKRPFKKLSQYRRDFYTGALERGVSPGTIDRIWTMIMSFSGYSFCKPHSASFALVSFKSAYIKAHYPAEFIAAVISNQGGYYSAFEYISEARRMNLSVLPPDINESEREYTGRGSEVRVGLMQLKGLREDAMEEVLAEREKGRFSSFEDFLKRTELDRSDVRLLVRAGCFDSISGEEERPRLMWRLQVSRGPARSREGTLPLFDLRGDACPSVGAYGEEAMLKHEAEVLGFLVTRHPLSLYREKLSCLEHTPADRLSLHVGRKVTAVGWLVTGKTVETKDEEPMEFVSFEDTTGIYEATFFPEAYRRFSHALDAGRPYVLSGKVESDMGAIYLNVQELRPLDGDSEGAGEESRAEDRMEIGALDLESLWAGRGC
jgi:error-prone DNA polymerase